MMEFLCVMLCCFFLFLFKYYVLMIDKDKNLYNILYLLKFMYLCKDKYLNFIYFNYVCVFM